MYFLFIRQYFDVFCLLSVSRRKYNLDIIEVLKNSQNNIKNHLPYIGDGVHINSDFLNGLNIQEAIKLSIEKLKKFHFFSDLLIRKHKENNYFQNSFLDI